MRRVVRDVFNRVRQVISGRTHCCACTLARALARNVFISFSLSGTTNEGSDARISSDCVYVESQLSRRATLVVIAADVFDVLNLDAHFFAVVVQANGKSVRIGRVEVADDTRRGVLRRGDPPAERGTRGSNLASCSRRVGCARIEMDHAQQLGVRNAR